MSLFSKETEVAAAKLEQAQTEAMPDSDLPIGPSGNGTIYGYVVQARYNFHYPEKFGDIILGKRWRTLAFLEVRPDIGVPIGDSWEAPIFKQVGCYSYEAAQALRWWFLAQANAHHPTGSLCLETRLVQMKVEYSHKSTPSGHVETLESARPSLQRKG